MRRLMVAVWMLGCTGCAESPAPKRRKYPAEPHVMERLRIEKYEEGQLSARIDADRARLNMETDYLQLSAIRMRFRPRGKRKLPGRRSGEVTVTAPWAVGLMGGPDLNCFGPIRLRDAEGQGVDADYAFFSGSTKRLLIPGPARFFGKVNAFHAARTIFETDTNRLFLFHVRGRILPRKRSAP